MSLRHLAFLLPGTHAAENPVRGLEEALELFALGELLGFDSAWIRQRHLERAVSSSPVFLAAATQRTRHIGLGTAVIQMGYETPFRLAEHLSTLDVLAHGRLQVGLSAGPPPLGGLLGQRLIDGDAKAFDFSHRRVERLRESLEAGEYPGEEAWVDSAAGRQRARLHPVAPGLSQRLWYGAGSLASAAWAGRFGLNLLLGNVSRAEQSDDYRVVQLQQLAEYRKNWQRAEPPRIALGRVIVPLDSADASSRRRWLEYAAGRHERTLAPQGPRRTLFVPDIVGTSDEIVE